ncbi:hypothetical protein BDW72DRAFT_120661 [Aspergillus terricola var. indicus]
MSTGTQRWYQVRLLLLRPVSTLLLHNEGTRRRNTYSAFLALAVLTASTGVGTAAVASASGSTAATTHFVSLSFK